LERAEDWNIKEMKIMDNKNDRGKKQTESE